MLIYRYKDSDVDRLRVEMVRNLPLIYNMVLSESGHVPSASILILGKMGAGDSSSTLAWEC